MNDNAKIASEILEPKGNRLLGGRIMDALDAKDRAHAEQIESFKKIRDAAKVAGLTLNTGVWVMPFYNSDGSVDLVPVDECIQRRKQAAEKIKELEAELAAVREENERIGKYMNVAIPERDKQITALEAELANAKENAKTIRDYRRKDQEENSKLRAALVRIRDEAKENKTQGGAVARATVGVIQIVAEKALSLTPEAAGKDDLKERIAFLEAENKQHLEKLAEAVALGSTQADRFDAEIDKRDSRISALEAGLRKMRPSNSTLHTRECQCCCDIAMEIDTLLQQAPAKDGEK